MALTASICLNFCGAHIFSKSLPSETSITPERLEREGEDPEMARLIGSTPQSPRLQPVEEENEG